LEDIYLVQTEFSAPGGVENARHLVRMLDSGEGLEVEHRVVRLIDHRESVRVSRRIVAHAEYVVQKHCARTPFGYVTTGKDLARLDVDFEEVRGLVRALNARARAAGSSRRVQAELYPFHVEPADDRTRGRLLRHVLERLEDLRDALRAGDKRMFRSAWTAARHVERVFPDAQGRIAAALRRAHSARLELGAAMKAGEDADEAGEGLDLRELEAAVAALRKEART